MRAPAIVDIYAGSAEDVLIPLLDDAGANVPDLTGWAGLAQVRYAPGTPVLAEWATADGTMELDASTARLKVSAALAVASLAWSWRTAWFDLLLTTPEGQGSLPQRPIRGIMRVTPGISTT